MGIWICFPKLTRCCYCTKKLRVACVFIAIWIMFVGAHGFSMCALPSCEDIFSKQNHGDLAKVLSIVKWIFFGSTIMLLISDFFFLLGILKLIGHRAVAKDVLFFCGFLWAVLAEALAILELLQMSNTECFNHNDIIACFVYTPCMIYFMLITNSFENLEGINDTVLPRKAKPPVKERIPKVPTTKLGKCIYATLKLLRTLFRKIKRDKTTLKPGYVSTLTPENITALTPENQMASTPENAGLMPENVTALTQENVTALTPENVAGLSPESVTEFMPENQTAPTPEK